MHRSRLALAIVLAGQPIFAQQTSTTSTTRRTGTAASHRTQTVPKKAAEPAPMTDEDKTIYAIGLSLSRSLAPLDLSPAELDVLKRALTDAAANKPAVQLDEWGPKIEPFRQARAARALDKQKAIAKAYLDKAAAEPGAVKTGSGLIYRETQPGTGASPKPNDTVKVNYRGTLIDGTEFDSSYKRNEPTSFQLNQVIPCWTEGVGKLKVGGKATLVCPSDIAYGDGGRPSIPGGATLIFDIELLDVTPAPQ